MKATALIEALEHYVEAYGDQEVTFIKSDQEVNINVVTFTQFTERAPHSHIILSEEK